MALPLNSQPAAATDTSKVGASDYNALGRKTNLHIREDLATQMWHRSLLRKKASAAWLHLGHTDKKSKNKNKIWASAEIAGGCAASLWDSNCFVRTRGEGVLQFLH